MPRVPCGRTAVIVTSAGAGFIVLHDRKVPGERGSTPRKYGRWRPRPTAFCGPPQRVDTALSMGQCSVMSPGDARLDLAGTDESSVVCQSLLRADPYAAVRCGLEQAAEKGVVR